MFKTKRYFKNSNPLMEEKLQQQTQKQAKEAKSCIKVQNEKAIVHNRQIVFKSQTKPENESRQIFFNFNKRKTFEKLGGKMLQNMEELENKGFIYLNVLVFLLYNIYYLI